MPDGVGRRGLVLSAALHLLLAAVLIFGLPSLFHPPTPAEMPIAVQLVTMGPETRATHPNPNMPEREATPEPPLPGPPAPKPAPEPTPPKPVPPPSAAEAPPQLPAPAPPRQAGAALTPTPPVEQPKQAELPPPPPGPNPSRCRLRRRPNRLSQPRRQSRLPSAPENRAQRGQGRSQEVQPGSIRRAIEEPCGAGHATFARRPAASDAPRRGPGFLATPRAARQPAQRQRSRHDPRADFALLEYPGGRPRRQGPGRRDPRRRLPDGTVQHAQIVDQGRACGDPFFRAAAESARRAFFNPLCTPLKSAADKYATWKDMVVDFSPKDVL